MTPRAPRYFGYQNMKTSGSKSGAGLKQGQNYSKYKKAKHDKIFANEKAFVKETPAPPITAGQVRQRFKAWGEQYARTANSDTAPNFPHPSARPPAAGTTTRRSSTRPSSDR
jgi:hypothetical protein